MDPVADPEIRLGRREVNGANLVGATAVALVTILEPIGPSAASVETIVVTRLDFGKGQPEDILRAIYKVIEEHPQHNVASYSVEGPFTARLSELYEGAQTPAQKGRFEGPLKFDL